MLLQALVVKPDGSSVAAGGGVVSVSIPIKQFIHCLEKQNAAYNLSFTFLDDFFPVISGPGHVLRGLRRLWTPILCFGAKKNFVGRSHTGRKMSGRSSQVRRTGRETALEDIGSRS